MNIPVIDKSNYLKGLLITARKDKQLTEPEKKILKSIAEKLGFANDFYEETINNLLANKYILEEPIEFSDKKIAESFVMDGLRLVFSDNLVGTGEIEWLRNTAIINRLSEKWFDESVLLCKANSGNLFVTDFALMSII